MLYNIFVLFVKCANYLTKNLPDDIQQVALRRLKVINNTKNINDLRVSLLFDVCFGENS